MKREPRLFVVSGPSGVGKGTVVAELRRQRPDLGLTVSATTRTPRPGEIHGQSYWFMSVEEFKAHIAADAFVEWAEVFGNFYGTLVSEVDKNLKHGHSVVIEIDVQGALQIMQRIPEAVTIFILPPSIEELERRLRGRGTEDEATIELRLATANKELTLAEQYTERVVNDSVEACVCALMRIMNSYECGGSTRECN